MASTMGSGAGSLLGGAASGAAGGAFGGPVGIAIGAGAGLLGSIFGAKKQSSSADKATAVSADYNNRALDAAREDRDYQRQQDAAAIARQTEQRDYSRAQFGSYQDRLSPYRTVGVNSLNRLDTSLAGNMAASVPTNGPNPSGGLVQMKAPNGQVKAIPANLVNLAIQKGAVRV